jgi:DNA-binding transcriptional ArsR family regulator
MGTNIDEKISSVLFGKTRRALLSIIYGHPDESFYLMQLVRMIDAGKGSVQRDLAQLTQAGIITREKIGQQIYYQANPKCPVYEELRLIVIKSIRYTARTKKLKT